MAFKMKGSPMARNYGAPFKQTEGTQGKTTKPVEGKVDWSKAPATNTQARKDWYTKNNLKQDKSTELKTDPPSIKDKVVKAAKTAAIDAIGGPVIAGARKLYQKLKGN